MCRPEPSTWRATSSAALSASPSLDEFDQLAMIADHLGASREREIESAAHCTQHLAMLPPELGRVTVVVALVHDGVERRVEFTMR